MSGSSASSSGTSACGAAISISWWTWTIPTPSTSAAPRWSSASTWRARTSGTCATIDDFSVDQGGRTTLTLPLRFEWAGVGSALRTALSSGEIPYEMKGQIRLQTPWGAHSVPFTREGRAPLTRVGGALPVPTSR